MFPPESQRTLLEEIENPVADNAKLPSIVVEESAEPIFIDLGNPDPVPILIAPVLAPVPKFKEPANWVLPILIDSVNGKFGLIVKPCIFKEETVTESVSLPMSISFVPAPVPMLIEPVLDAPVPKFKRPEV